MNILVAGGAGTVGVRISDALLDAGHRVVVLDDMSGASSADGARWLDPRHDATTRLSFVFRSVLDAQELDRAIANVDAVIHAAAPPSGADSPEELSVRVQGTLALLGAMERRAPDAHLVLLSDSGIYGCPALLRGGTAMFAAREQQVLAPETPGAVAAACAEQYAFAAARSGLRKTTILRLPCVYASDTLYAAGETWHARLVAAAKAGDEIVALADPRWPADLLHADDLALAVRMVLERPDVASGEVYNVGGGARLAPSLWELVEHLATLGGRARLTPPLTANKPSPVLDLGKIKRALNWQPQVSWRDGLARLFTSLSTGWEASTRSPAAAGSQALVAWPRAEGLA